MTLAATSRPEPPADHDQPESAEEQQLHVRHAVALKHKRVRTQVKARVRLHRLKH